MKKCREGGWMEGGSGEVKPERLDGGMKITDGSWCDRLSSRGGRRCIPS